MNAKADVAPDAQAMLLTPAGRGAVATIQVQGPSAVSHVGRLFVAASGRALGEVPVGEIAYGRWRDPNGEEVVVCRPSAESVEIHCHGGAAASAGILRDLHAKGVAILDWSDLLRERFPDSIRAAALEALSRATTTRTAAILCDQYHGALRRALERIHQALVGGNAKSALRLVAELLTQSSLGLHLTMPWRVALVGRPNVGKSSLLNALLGFGRAIVHDAPGTTRDLVTGLTACHGWPCQLIDTAGLRDTDEPIEQAGVALASQALREADLVLWVRDVTSPAVADDALRDSLPENALVIWNKCDLPSNGPRGATELEVSALTGDGINQLVEAIATRLAPAPPLPGEGVPFTPAHGERLRDVEKLLIAGELVEATARMAQWLRAQQHGVLPGELCEPS